MKCHLAILSLAFMLTGCLTLQQQQHQAGFNRVTQSELQLLRYAATQADRAVVRTSLPSPEPDEGGRIVTWPLQEEELQQLKEILSCTSAVPYSGQSKSPQWNNAEVGIRLYNAAGIFLFELNENMLTNCDASASGAHSMFTLPDAQLKRLQTLPTLLLAKEHMNAEKRYAGHCRFRATTAEKIRKAADKAHSAQVSLEHLDGTEVKIDLEGEELQQLKQILNTACPLPAMSRADWDNPESHCMPVPPLLVFSYLKLLDSEGNVLYKLPLDYQHLAAQSEMEQLRHSEGEGQAAILPDDQKAAFVALPFWAKVHEKRTELMN